MQPSHYDFVDFKAEELNLKEGKKINFFYPDEIENSNLNKVVWFDKIYTKSLNKLKKILINNKNMNIEKATIKNLKEIESLNNKFFHEKRNFKEIIENKNNNFFVAKEKKIIVGFSGIHHFRWNNTAQIIDIFIHPDYRGKGYANQFIKKIKIISKKLKVRTIIAEAPSLNNVLAVYLKNGFRICGFNDRYYCNDAKEIALFLSCDIN